LAYFFAPIWGKTNQKGQKKHNSFLRMGRYCVVSSLIEDPSSLQDSLFPIQDISIEAFASPPLFNNAVKFTTVIVIEPGSY
jgi:hypothetical protein